MQSPIVVQCGFRESWPQMRPTQTVTDVFVFGYEKYPGENYLFNIRPAKFLSNYVPFKMCLYSCVRHNQTIDSEKHKRYGCTSYDNAPELISNNIKGI